MKKMKYFLLSSLIILAASCSNNKAEEKAKEYCSCANKMFELMNPENQKEEDWFNSLDYRSRIKINQGLKLDSESKEDNERAIKYQELSKKIKSEVAELKMEIENIEYKYKKYKEKDPDKFQDDFEQGLRQNCPKAAKEILYR